MPRHTLRKSPTDTYFFRSIIPKDLLSIFGGRSYFTISLRNGIRKESEHISYYLNSVVQHIYQELRMCKLKTLSIDQIKEILKTEVEKSKRHSNYYAYVGIDRSDKKMIEKGLDTLEKDQIELKKKKKTDFDDEVEKLLSEHGYKINKNSIPFRTLRENLIGVKNQTIKRKKEILLGKRKPELNFVEELFDESEELFDELKSMRSQRIVFSTKRFHHTFQS